MPEAARAHFPSHRVLAVNLSGAFFLSQAVPGHMAERGTGRIVNISSVIGSTGNIGHANYAATGQVGGVNGGLDM